MLDRNFVRDNIEEVKKALARRGDNYDLSEFEKISHKLRDVRQEEETLNAKINSVSKSIGELFRSGKKDDPEFAAQIEQLKAESNETKEKAKVASEQRRDLSDQQEQILYGIPNLPSSETPEGKDENDNPVVRTVGEKPEFSFKPREHFDLGEMLGLLDPERATRMAKSRFSLSYGALARMERALTSFMLDLHTEEHGYTEVLPPFLVNRTAMTGTGQLPKFEDDLFHTTEYDLFLIPTAEVPITNIRSGEIIEDEELPLKYCAYTPCFRKEAGSAGKDTRGLIRQHQFNKVELVKYVRPEDSYAELEDLTANAEEVLKRLELHYRVVELCSGDIGFSAAKTNDLEVWLPGANAYREISSCSNFEDYQARRMSIRYRPAPKAKTRLVHTINGSGLAVGRTIVAILENYQREDGSITIPEALQSYMGGMTEIKLPEKK
jgi:seryl-tRNA synthetase